MLKLFETLFMRRPFGVLQIEITSKCNAMCIMCPHTIFIEQWNSGDMDMETYKQISKIFPLVRKVHFNGWGEPLIYEKIFEMIKIAKSSDCDVILTTNGALLTSEIIDKLIELHLNSLIVSIDGATPETFEKIRVGLKFNEIVKNLKTLEKTKLKEKAKKPETSIAFTLMKENINELPLLVKLAYEIGVKKIIVRNLDFPLTHGSDVIFLDKSTNNGAKIIVDKAKAEAKKLKLNLISQPQEMHLLPVCDADPIKNVYISWEGFVCPCEYLGVSTTGLIKRFLQGKEHKTKPLNFGNVRNEDFSKIRNKEEYRIFRKSFESRLLLYPEITGGLYKLRHYGFLDLEILKERSKKFEKELSLAPLPQQCKDCYKIYGV